MKNTLAAVCGTFMLAYAFQSMAAAVDFEKQQVTIALTQEPPNLNTMRTTDLVSFFVIGHIMEGLLRYDRRGRLIPAIAESWQMKGREVIFQLRKEALWSDGKPITAYDFEFAWRKMVDPEFAAPYAAILFPILNAEAIHKGEMQVSSLGVAAVDANTLKVTLEVPQAYFPGMMVHAAFYPVREDFFLQQGEQYGADPEHLLYNGPFMLTQWTHGASLTMDKNPDYWDADRIPLNRINIGYITEDNRARLNLFRDDAIAVARLDAETIKDAVSQRLKVRTFVTGGIAYLQFNMREQRPSNLKSLRKAIQATLDPEVFVNKVIAVPGYKPAFSLFPSWINGVEEKFIEEYPPIVEPKNPQSARRWMTAARKSFKGEIPPLTLLTVSSPTGLKIAEYLQGILQTELGLTIRIDNQTFKQYLVKANAGDFDISIASWFPDFDDIMTYADLLASWNPNNRGRYQSQRYDTWLGMVQKSPNSLDRMKAGAELQRIIYEDAVILPLLETGSAYLQHPKLRGLVRRVIGPDPDYAYSRIIK
jgi:oligopeptide transport system substrate-binding protein